MKRDNPALLRSLPGAGVTDFFAIIPNWLPGWLGAGAAAGGGFGMIKWLAEFVGGRMDRRSDRLDASTDKIIKLLEARVDQLTTRLDLVEAELVDCQRKHAESEAEVMRLKAVMQGYGDARDAAQRIVAVERLQSGGGL